MFEGDKDQEVLSVEKPIGESILPPTSFDCDFIPPFLNFENQPSSTPSPLINNYGCFKGEALSLSDFDEKKVSYDKVKR